MTFLFCTFNDIAYQFLFNKPYVYSSHLTTTLEKDLPNMVSVLNKKWITANGTSVYLLKTKGGVSITSFAKNANWNQDLYENLVQVTLKNSMVFETWQNGAGGAMPSFCEPKYMYDSMNIENISLTNYIGWPESKDHSKWGITVDTTSETSWICIGDINRVYSQYTRAGGTECFQEYSLFQSFKLIVADVESCPSSL